MNQSSIHNLYLAVFANARQADRNYAVQLMTTIMSRQRFSWRVVGITPAALAQFKLQENRYKPRCGITRAHITPRADMVKHVLDRDEPLSQFELMRYWLETDRTVICARGENKKVVPGYLPIDNPHGDLFTSKPLAGFQVKKGEQDLLVAMQSEQ